MTLVKFKKRPISNLVPTNFFDMDNFLDNSLWNRDILRGDFWNEKASEPALNIIETDKNFEIELAAPGFSKKDFEVTIADGCLNISAEKSTSKKEEEKNYTRKEFSYDFFERSLPLPDSVKEEEIKASYHDGILSFNLAKKKEAKKQKPKVIEIV